MVWIDLKYKTDRQTDINTFENRGNLFSVLVNIILIGLEKDASKKEILNLSKGN